MSLASKIIERNKAILEANKVVKEISSKIRLAKSKKELDSISDEIDKLAHKGDMSFKDARLLNQSIDRKIDSIQESKILEFDKNAADWYNNTFIPSLKKHASGVVDMMMIQSDKKGKVKVFTKMYKGTQASDIKKAFEAVNIKVTKVETNASSYRGYVEGVFPKEGIHENLDIKAVIPYISNYLNDDETPEASLIEFGMKPNKAKEFVTAWFKLSPMDRDSMNDSEIKTMLGRYK
jgi:hypothetical protein